MPSGSLKAPRKKNKAPSVIQTLLSTALGLAAIVFTVMGATNVTSLLTKATANRTVVKSWNFSQYGGGSGEWNYICVDRRIEADRIVLFEPNPKCGASRVMETGFGGTKDSGVQLPAGNKYFTIEAMLKPAPVGMGTAPPLVLSATDQASSGFGGLMQKMAEIFRLRRPPPNYPLPTPYRYPTPPSRFPSKPPPYPSGVTRPSGIPTPAVTRSPEKVPLVVSYVPAGSSSSPKQLLVWLEPGSDMGSYDVRFPDIGEIRITKLQLLLDSVMKSRYEFSIRYIALTADTPPTRPTPRMNPVSWHTDTVNLEASNFYMDINGKRYFARPDSGDVSIHSVSGNPAYTTLETVWHESGVEMRLFLYFTADSSGWKVKEIRTYNGDAPGDWIYYSAPYIAGTPEKPFIGNWTNISSSDQTPTHPASGVIHFDNLNLRAFKDRLPSPVPVRLSATLVSPKTDETVQGETIFKAEAVSASRIDRVEFYAGSAFLMGTVRNPNYWLTYDTNKLMTGVTVTQRIPFYVKAFDDKGNQALSPLNYVYVVPPPSPTVNRSVYSLEMRPSGEIVMPVSTPTTGYAISVILKSNGVTVADQRNLTYAWSIDEPSVARITPQTGYDNGGCTYGISPPCPYNYLDITALKPTEKTYIRVNVTENNNPAVTLASAAFSLTVTQ